MEGATPGLPWRQPPHRDQQQYQDRPCRSQLGQQISAQPKTQSEQHNSENNIQRTGDEARNDSAECNIFVPGQDLAQESREPAHNQYDGKQRKVRHESGSVIEAPRQPGPNHHHCHCQHNIPNSQ